MLVIRAGSHKMLVGIANREDPDQTASSRTGKTQIRLLLQKQSDLGLPCLSMHFWQAISVGNFRTFYRTQ